MIRRYPLGLRFFIHDLRHPSMTILSLAALVGVLVCLADIFFFTALLPPAYVQLIHDTGAAVRIILVGGRSLLDEIAFRLGVMTLLVWTATLLWRPRNAIYWGAIVLAQLINILVQGSLPTTLPEVAFSLIRIELPGVLWGYLYWRHGFATAALTHASSHAVVQPLLTFFL